jgi:recombination protein RecT
VLAHWITDRDLPRRFDVPFLVARMPEGQQPVADEAEQFEPLWVRPADALARHKAGQFFMIFPTIRTLERMQEVRHVDAVLAACASEQPLWTSCPRAGLLGGKEARYMEGDDRRSASWRWCAPTARSCTRSTGSTERRCPLLKNVMRSPRPTPA